MEIEEWASDNVLEWQTLANCTAGARNRRKVPRSFVTADSTLWEAA